MTSPSVATPTSASPPTPSTETTPTKKKRGRPKGPSKAPPRPAEEAASPQARRTATVLLEVLAGLRSTGEAARTLGVTPMRFYAIEERAIGGLIAACEPRQSGFQPEARAAHELVRLHEQVRRQGLELNQVRSVLRTTQRQLGVTPPEPKPKAGGADQVKKRKNRRPTIRALTMVRRLMQADAVTASQSPPPGAVPAPPAVGA